MKLAFKIVAMVFSATFLAYHSYFWVMPSVTLTNIANKPIASARVTLPNSGLSFGEIKQGGENTIHYTLEQADGDYHYQIIFESGEALSGVCGYVTNHEINKRLLIKVDDSKAMCQKN
ncbi:hypothetical protein LP316_11005 [Thalassotalea sp. LPB0316]|uniref:hypothetical protein n=1 Tax=Thalassotalea sp. LPB0316 TaxID=2769490 RepID=UPI001867499A|nr:hypothetical protein [Thalassotalea sp. LPB0316]QOL24837.1 hypothetical protein LP316_11005 [Thalassotalea sp. LPB0316]